MNQPVPTVLLGFGPDETRDVEKVLGENLHVLHQSSEIRDGLTQLVPLQPQAVLLYFSPDDLRMVLQFARRARHDAPDAALILVSSQESVEATREAVRLGARAVAVLGVDDRDLLATFEQLRREVHETVKTGIVVSFMGAKGGMGTTSIALNVASALAQDPKNRVLLIDFALFIGEVGVYLDMATPYSLGDYILDLGRLTDAWIDERIPKHRTGFFVLSQPPEVNEIAALEAHQIVAAVSTSKRFFTHVVLDTGAQVSEASLGGINASDMGIIITTQELPAIVSTGRRVNLLTQLHGDRTRIRVVVNRFQSKDTSRKRIEQFAGHGVGATVCNDYASMSRCIETGQLLLELAPEAEITADIAKLIRLFDDETTVETKTRKKLFGLF
ncbi:MAG: pilus assembly protein CpaE [Cognaticolwellia sp.]|jgi:pilus assembly protein CpaE